MNASQHDGDVRLICTWWNPCLSSGDGVGGSHPKSDSPAHRFGHLGHFHLLPVTRASWKGLLFGDMLSALVFSPIFLLSAAGDGGIWGCGGIWMICAAVAALSSLMEKEAERERDRETERKRAGGGRRWSLQKLS